MKRNTRISILVFALLIVCTINSCKKEWLNEKADKTQAVPTRLKDFQALLDEPLFMNSNVFPLGEAAADGHYITETAWTLGGDAARNAYTWSHDRPYINLITWSFIYSRIFTTNIILDRLKFIKDNLTSQSELSEWNNIKGQALFQRSICFFYLSQLFALPYNSSTASSDMGIPLRLDADVEASSKRFTVKETYDRLINDLNEAVSLLPPTPASTTRGSKIAAYGLLARIYLIMSDYNNALISAENCLNIKDDLLDFSQLIPSANSIGGSPNFANPLLNPEILFYDRIYVNDVSNFISTQYLIEQDFYNLFSNNDLRRTIYFRTNTNGSVVFRGNYNNVSSNSWFCGIATDEIYLIKAECLARKDNITESMNTLNKLLRKRFNNTFVDYTANTGDDALAKVLQERRKELVLRNLRWSDLRRLNNDDRFKITLTRNIAGVTYTLEPNSYKYTFPLPADILSISGMPQTPGW